MIRSLTQEFVVMEFEFQVPVPEGQPALPPLPLNTPTFLQNPTHRTYLRLMGLKQLAGSQVQHCFRPQGFVLGYITLLILTFREYVSGLAEALVHLFQR